MSTATRTQAATSVFGVHFTAAPYAGLLPNGHEETSFWRDYTIAEVMGGTAAVQDTFNRSFREWRHNVTYLIELTFCLNFKCWQHHEKGHDDLARLYAELYEKANDWAYSNLKGDDLSRFFQATD